MGALALRYVYNTGGAWRPFAEVGGWGVPDATFTFSRTYANGSGLAVGTASTDASKFYVYGRLGAAFAPSIADEAAFSIEVGRAELHTGLYAEAFSRLNPFEAQAPSATDGLTIGKIRAQWTHMFTDQIDATAYLAGADAFGSSSNFNVGVPGFGLVSPTKVKDPLFAEYGGRIGYKLRPNAVIDVFANGVSGNDGIGTDVQVGADFRLTF